ncbi:biotin/lipoyl-binding protein [Microbacterium fluvii]|uniref:Biotin/lipoyl-binding protein n=1 Tax=Microbacterium fluvii TaxID=415215 RepID=A0ABW2HH76_9MICO|nr:biotin/lipoyl-binding protein [Microbacterium fluvii]MCU4673501.1 biotin/lipoyl-binding protein [Microbacterium fluvii]
MSPRSFIRKIPRWTWFTLSTVLVAVVGLSIWAFGFLLPSQQAAAETITQTATADLQTMEKSVTTTGTVTPTVQEDVSFAVSGTVTKVAVEAGETVEKGQTLAKVDTLELKASLLEAKATLAEAEATLATAEDDNDGTDSAQAREDAAAAAVEVAQESVDDAEDAMDDATLVAPADGLITSVGVAVGDKISGSSSSGSSSTSGGSGATMGGSGSSSTSTTTTSSSAAFTLVSTDSWSLDVTVGETDVSNVAAGDQVELTTDDGTEYFGLVEEVGLLPSTTSGSAAYPVSIAVTGDGEGLFDGVSVDVSIIYERRTDVLAVPSAAVTTADGTSTVTVVADDGTQTETPVEVGDSSGSYTEIVSGIDEGTTVLVASFTPGEGNSGTTGGFPSDGEFPSDGTFPGGGEMPSDGQFPGGGQMGGGMGGNQ